MSALLRQYERWECLGDGYPEAWHRSTAYGSYPAGHSLANPAIKDLIRGQAGHRCLRCRHAYRKGEHGNGEWSPCDRECEHPGPFRVYQKDRDGTLVFVEIENASPDWSDPTWAGFTIEAKRRILTVHHLDE